MEMIVSEEKTFYSDFLDILEDCRIYYCLLGGIAVNCYTDPLENQDLELVVKSDQLDALILTLKKQFIVERTADYFKVYEKPQTTQVRILLGDRYQPFVGRAQLHNILDFEYPVASLKDVLKAKEWSAMGKNTRPTERQKDLADIARILAVKPSMDKSLPMKLRKQLVVG